jgi:hypothetical protein
MINKKKKNLKENVLRSYIRREIAKIMEAEEEQAPEEAPKEEPAEEEDYSQFEAIAQNMVRKLKDGGVSVGNEELVVMVSNIIEAFADSSEQKLNVLKGVKSNIVR